MVVYVVISIQGINTHNEYISIGICTYNVDITRCDSKKYFIFEIYMLFVCLCLFSVYNYNVQNTCSSEFAQRVFKLAIEHIRYIITLEKLKFIFQFYNTFTFLFYVFMPFPVGGFIKLS